MRQRLRYKHYSFSTEKVYVYWIRFFIRWSGMRHPAEMGSKEVEAFLTMLPTERHATVAPQALAALQQAAIQDANVFEKLMEAARVCSLGQITNALFDVGGQYRRNM